MITNIRYIENENEEIESYFATFEKIGEINLTELIEESIQEVHFIGNNSNFIQVNYSNWDSMELCAIVNTHAQIVFKNIYSIECFIENKEYFICTIKSDYIDENQFYFYGLEMDEYYNFMINSNGEILISFTNESLEYELNENMVFVGKKNKYNLG